jgi:hypothetical protein
VSLSRILGKIPALAEAWQPCYIVCDSTGVGASVASFLEITFNQGSEPSARYKATARSPVIPFVFTVKSKSELGWNFLRVIETCRFQDHSPSELRNANREQQFFWRQLKFCQNEILVGPGRMIRWGVPDGIRDLATAFPSGVGAQIHDDLVISAALCTVLDEQTWGMAVSEIIPGKNPLSGLKDIRVDAIRPNGIDPLSDMGETY